ncbi:hypothetical protein [Desulfosporosinus sp. SB140]|uniref:hypothetical protein n=1 Tax=Desulfosporosinus paludis TaxID=3115649 RepID=UPI00389045E7
MTAPMLNRKTKNSRTQAKQPCKCLSCKQPWREKYEDLTMLVCGDEACYLDCAKCTERPHRWAYVPVEAVI